jgi:penicillin-insensitive murein DD-endopeptidase
VKLRRRTVLFGALPVISLAAYVGLIAWLGIDRQQPSICRGTVNAGSLQGARRLAYQGDNYRAYSIAGYVLGRTFVHGTVRDAMRDAYVALGREHPALRFVYAESSWPWGGRLDPHKSHRNGTAVDFHVPVRTADGQVEELPTSVFNLFGYGVDFDKSGRSGALRIDFEAIALHLLALERAARNHGIGIQRVIFDVELQPKLFATASGGRLRDRLSFNQTQSWVRHDEHYHVDFDVPCRRD